MKNNIFVKAKPKSKSTKQTAYLLVNAKQRLPKRAGTYICKFNNQGHMCWQDALFQNGNFFIDAEFDKVTHWLEKIQLPEPQREPRTFKRLMDFD